LNPIIKFTTLFGMLALEIAITDSFRDVAVWFGLAFLIVALIFVYRSFYGMRISSLTNLVEPPAPDKLEGGGGKPEEKPAGAPAAEATKA
jgi:K(+)-stimulated pyrophosphate-energized sodium pump